MIGSYTIIKNEAQWIGGHILMWLAHLDQMVFFDGNSTDGTLEIIEAIQNNEKQGYKIKLVKDRDPKNLQEDYERVFNECLWSLDTDLAFFLHPDMVPVAGKEKFTASDCLAAFVRVRSFAGEPGGPLFEIKGRGERWKSIVRLRNPNLGAKYHGFYGAANEDTYLTEITGNEFNHYGEHFNLYPYEVKDSGIELLHFSDVRPYSRRLQRMKTCLLNQGHKPEMVEKLASEHPRVTLKPGEFNSSSFSLIPAEYPKEFIEAKNKYSHLVKELSIV